MKLLSLIKELSLNPKNAGELKRLILQLAFQGKLTARWRKGNLQSNGKVELEQLLGKTENKLSKRDFSDLENVMDTFSKDELPSSWGLCHLTEVANFWNGKAHEGCVHENGEFILVNSRFVSTNGARSKRVTENLSPLSIGDIAIVMSDVPNGRALSRCYLVEENNKFSLNQRIGGVTPIKGISYIYLALVLDRNPHYLAVNDGQKQTNLKRIHMISCPVPFPPLEEQKAIVEVVNILFKEVEALENLTKERISLKEDFVTSALRRLTETDNTSQEWNYLKKHFSSFFTEKKNIKSLRETILQLAVQGKLTAQWRKENSSIQNASILFNKIKEDKEQLIKEKKIRPEKPLPRCQDSDFSEELPSSWVWCRFAEIVINRDGDRKPITKSDRIKGDYDYYGASGVIDKVKDYIFDKDLLLIGEDGANLIARSTPIAFFARGKYWVNNHAHVIDATNFTILEYLEKYINAINLEDYITGMAQPKMPQKRMNIIPVPLPPLEEQQAIVEKVNSLMALCDKLEQQIDNSQTQIEQLMQSCLKEVFEQESS